MLSALHGGCLAPIAAWARMENGRLTLTGRVLSPDGRRKIETTLAADSPDPSDLGRRVAEELLDKARRNLSILHGELKKYCRSERVNEI